jgi:hypothetical protein
MPAESGRRETIGRRGSARRMSWLCLTATITTGFVLSPPAGARAVDVKAGVSRQDGTLAQSADEEKARLENEKLRQEIENLRSERSPWRQIPEYAAIGTALAALLGFLFTAWSGIRQREGESLRRFDERFDMAVTNLASQQPVLQVSAAAALVSFSKPQYGRFHEQVLMVALSILKTPQSPEIQRLLMGAFEQAARAVLPKPEQDARRGRKAPGVLPGLDLTHAHLDRVDLSGLDLSGFDIAFAEMSRASLRGANLYRVRGIQVRLEHARLTDANLGEARLKEAHAQGAHFHRTRLMSARLEAADLRDAQFQEALLQSAHLNGADLRGANFVDSNVRDTYFQGATFDDLALRTLAKAHHLADAHVDEEVMQRIASLVPASRANAG